MANYGRTHDIESVLALNPVVKKHANLTPTIKTKAAREFWKRNEEPHGPRSVSCGMWGGGGGW